MATFPATRASGQIAARRAVPAAPETRFDRRLGEILDHATEVFCEKGYEGASMRDLSRATGMSLAGLYHYFESKERLLYLIQKHTFTTIVEQLKARLEGVTDPEQRIRIFILNHLEYFVTNQSGLKVLSHEDEALKNGFSSEIAAIKREYYRICLGLMDDLKRERRSRFQLAHRRHEPVRHDQLDLHLVQPARRRQRRGTCAEQMSDIVLAGVGRGVNATAAHQNVVIPSRPQAQAEDERGICSSPSHVCGRLKQTRRSNLWPPLMQPATDETTKQLINYRTDAGVAVIEMNDPPANTYTYEMNRQLDDAILKARMDNDVHVIVLTGAGDKFFSAGANIKMLASVDPTFKYYFCLHANETLLRLEHTPKLVIAAINGHCVGGGLEIAMAADIRIARKDAGKIGLPEVNLGVLPGTGGTQRLSRLVGKSKAIELMITGNTFSFEEAKELGIINDIFERDGFMENIMEYARQFTPPNKAAKAVGRIKRAVQTGWEIPMESALAVERENQQILFQSEDAKEGLAAYVEKRPAEFTAK